MLTLNVCDVVIRPDGNSFLPKLLAVISSDSLKSFFMRMSDVLLQWCLDQLHHQFGLEACEDIIK